MLGLSTRNYGRAVHAFAESYGNRDVGGQRAFYSGVGAQKCANCSNRLVPPYEFPRKSTSMASSSTSQHLVVALGVNNDGPKVVLGMRQGATENSVVVAELFADLADRSDQLERWVARFFWVAEGKLPVPDNLHPRPPAVQAKAETRDSKEPLVSTEFRSSVAPGGKTTPEPGAKRSLGALRRHFAFL